MTNPNCEYGRSDCMPCTNCDAYIPTKTNADHIRSMTDEELAKWYGAGMCGGQTVDACRNKFHGNCSACALDWLKQPYKEDT